MSEFLCAVNDGELQRKYDNMIWNMIDNEGLDLSKYPDESVNITIDLIPLDVIPEETSRNDYAESIYRKCIEEKKPWQEFLTLEELDYENNIY